MLKDPIVKRTFGSVFRRIMSGGTVLTPVEHQLIERLVAALPASLRGTVEAQFEAYNLVQREVDGRALNFYRTTTGRAGVADLPQLAMTQDVAPLVRLTANIEGQKEPVHATLTAVSGRAFCIGFSRALPAKGGVSVVKTKQAWRSKFAGGEDA